MFSALLAILLVPETDKGKLKGLQFRPLNKIALYIFVTNFLVLLLLGAIHVESFFYRIWAKKYCFIFFTFFFSAWIKYHRKYLY